MPRTMTYADAGCKKLLLASFAEWAYICRMAQTMQDGWPAWTLGDRIVKARKHGNVKQAELAETLKVSRATVSDFENDVREPRPAQLRKIAFRCGVPFVGLTGRGLPGPEGGSTQGEPDSIWYRKSRGHRLAPLALAS